MYVPPHFEEPRVEVMHELIRARPFATLVTLSSDGLNANHIPLHLSLEPGPQGNLGTLRGHVARANTVWQDLAGGEALAIFHGPDSYVTPSWYPTKREDGRVLPTWNYTVVHAHGPLRVIDDPVWLRAQLEILTDQHEASFREPWAVSDAPRKFTESRIGAIVGIEIVIGRLSGKWKLSQNQAEQNRAGVVLGLREKGDPDAMEMAALIESGKPQ